MATKDSIIAKNICDLCAENDVWIEFRDNYIIRLIKFDNSLEKPRVYHKAYSINLYLNPITSFEDVITDFSNEADIHFEQHKMELKEECK